MTNNAPALLVSDDPSMAARLVRALSDLPPEVRERIVVVDTIAPSDLPPFLGNPAIHPIPLSADAPGHTAPPACEEIQGQMPSAIFQHMLESVRHVPCPEDAPLVVARRGAPAPNDKRPGHLKGLGSHITSARRAR